MKGSCRLSGMALFLSASVPARRSGYERLDLNVDEAVITLARTVFAEGGQLVFGGHPSISPLVLTIASEYDSDAPLALIYQSEIFQNMIPEKTLMLEAMGYGHIVWTAAAEGEELLHDGTTGRWLVPRSLEIMRRAMIEETSPAAYVSAGGMEGVEQEVDLFHELRPAAPVYAIESTGGASATLAASRSYVTAIDRKIETDIRKGRGGNAVIDLRPAALYPVVMERIVFELTGRNAYDG
jgi:hypothetical protein